jgi:preprotein translocase SecE subunit
MARDRKRAKQRRRKRNAPSSSPGDAARADDALRGEDIGLGAEPGDTGLEAGADEVDEAELALLAEQAAAEEVVVGGEGLDELEAELAREARPGSPARRDAVDAGVPRGGNRFINFLRASIAELGRVQWPDRRQVVQATAVVLGFVVIAGGYLGLMDAIFQRLVDALLKA